MNDDFLYELRTPPSARFAARLKARLEFQAAVAAAKRRATKWYVFFGILLGTAAVAAVTPVVREAMGSWFGGSTDVIHAESPDDGAKTRYANAGPSTAAVGVIASSAEQEPTQAASPSASTSATASAPRPRVRVIVDPDVPEEVSDMMIESFEDTYGYTVDRKVTSVYDSACQQTFHPDVIVTFNSLSEYQQKSCERRAAPLVDVVIALDAYVAIAHRESTWVKALTLEDLRVLGRTPRDLLTTWNQLRPSWPSLPLILFGVDSNNRTFSENFDADRVKNEFPIQVRRNDASAIAAVEATYGSVGFVSYATLRAHQEAEAKQGRLTTVKFLEIDDEKGEIVLRSSLTANGHYSMLGRPLLLQMNAYGLRRREVLLFGTHAVEGTSQRLSEYGLLPIDKLSMDTAARKLRATSVGQ